MSAIGVELMTVSQGITFCFDIWKCLIVGRLNSVDILMFSFVFIFKIFNTTNCEVMLIVCDFSTALIYIFLSIVFFLEILFQLLDTKNKNK